MICISFCNYARITACGAVLICHCLSLAPGFKRFDDFKIYSLRCSPMIPISCYSYPCTGFSPAVRVGLCDQ